MIYEKLKRGRKKIRFEHKIKSIAIFSTARVVKEWQKTWKIRRDSIEVPHEILLTRVLTIQLSSDDDK